MNALISGAWLYACLVQAPLLQSRVWSKVLGQKRNSKRISRTRLGKHERSRGKGGEGISRGKWLRPLNVGLRNMGYLLQAMGPQKGI